MFVVEFDLLPAGVAERDITLVRPFIVAVSTRDRLPLLRFFLFRLLSLGPAKPPASFPSTSKIDIKLDISSSEVGNWMLSEILHVEKYLIFMKLTLNYSIVDIFNMYIARIYNLKHTTFNQWLHHVGQFLMII